MITRSRCTGTRRRSGPSGSVPPPPLPRPFSGHRTVRTCCRALTLRAVSHCPSFRRFSCSCCPPNVSRLISTLGTYVCSASPSLSSDAGQSAAIVLAVHQYVACEISLDAHGLPGGKLVIETQYPFEGDVGIRFKGCEGGTVGLKLRVPVWAGTDWTVRF